MQKPVWLEVSLNGPWSRSKQPKIPVLADEIVDDAMRCVGADRAKTQFLQPRASALADLDVRYLVGRAAQVRRATIPHFSTSPQHRYLFHFNAPMWNAGRTLAAPDDCASD